jgi:hypothetical protein
MAVGLTVKYWRRIMYGYRQLVKKNYEWEKGNTSVRR